LVTLWTGAGVAAASHFSILQNYKFHYWQRKNTSISEQVGVAETLYASVSQPFWYDRPLSTLMVLQTPPQNYLVHFY
jgi:hypothetical protein